ncbi:hypothetical protein XBO1_2000005 [Xenorhabdus bovienii str. oregonense]|uniref:Uncharacterized protein n=1 Tax=Xenorhabdus bovienii str. oregonense TaxID=1398202 RepID=A0A077P3V9_XENBV|nr:hypothetical protein XBO1_2000005 [Xenorhabdus bovienii str. oregonense]
MLCHRLLMIALAMEAIRHALNRAKMRKEMMLLNHMIQKVTHTL